MTKKNNFPKEVIEEVMAMQNGKCKECINPIMDFHHRLSNSKANNQAYPLFIQSIFNCVGLCRSCHDSPAIYSYKISHNEACAYELALKKIKEGR